MVDRIVGAFQPARVVLFGSHARGTSSDQARRKAAPTCAATYDKTTSR